MYRGAIGAAERRSSRPRGLHGSTPGARAVPSRRTQSQISARRPPHAVHRAAAAAGSTTRAHYKYYYTLRRVRRAALPSPRPATSPAAQVRGRVRARHTGSRRTSPATPPGDRCRGRRECGYRGYLPSSDPSSLQLHHRARAAAARADRG